MATWKIAYSKNNNTEVLEADFPSTPDMEQAVATTLEYARQHYEAEEPAGDAQEEVTPAVRLAEYYGITITGISQAD